MAAMGERRSRRPVEFRGLSTHYVAGENIHVCFRYPVTSFEPNSDDKIKLYLRKSRESSLASAVVGDPSEHRLCDGGLYKSGNVVISTTRVSGSSERSYVLLYGSTNRHQVVGKSQPFIICEQKDFPSIQIQNIEDRVFIEKLRSHSPINQTRSNEENDDLSFAMVSGVEHTTGSECGEEWDVIEDENSEQSEVVDNSSSDSSNDSSDDEEDITEQTPSRNKPFTTEVEDIPPTNHMQSNSIEDDISLSEQQLLKTEDESATTTVMLKSSNKEMRTKIRVLHDKLHCVIQERDGLKTEVEGIKQLVSELKKHDLELKRRNRKLMTEKAELKSKNKQLIHENAVLTNHCDKQLAKMTQYENELKTVSTENQHLQRRLHHRATKKQVIENEHHTAVPMTVKSSPSKDASKKTTQKRPVIDVYVRDKQTTSPKMTNGSADIRPARQSQQKRRNDEKRDGDIGSLSEQHIQSIMTQLKGGQVSYECPVCMKKLHSHETQYSIQLHVEQCLLNTS